MAIQQSIKAEEPLKREGNAWASEGHADHWTVLRGLLPYVCPTGRQDVRLRVVLALAVLVLANVVSFAVPIFYEEATDLLASSTPGLSFEQGVGLIAGALIVAYGA